MGELTGSDVDEVHERQPAVDSGAAVAGTHPGQPGKSPCMSSMSMPNTMQGLLGVMAVGGSRASRGALHAPAAAGVRHALTGIGLWDLAQQFVVGTGGQAQQVVA